MPKITRWAPFWVPFCVTNRAGSEVPGAGSEVPGAGSEVPGAGSEVPGAGPSPGSKKSEKVILRPPPRDQVWTLNRHCQSHFDLKVHFVTFV